MTDLELLAVKLHDHLWANLGVTDDWPLQVGGDDEAVDKLIRLMNEIQAEIKSLGGQSDKTKYIPRDIQ